MKFKLVNDNGNLDLIAADGVFKSCITEEKVLDYLLSFQPMVPDSKHSKEVEEYEGKTIMVLRDDDVLEIHDIVFLRELLSQKDFPYYTVQQYCDIVKKGRSIVQRNCKGGNIPGAISVGNTWLIPKSAAYPPDNRCKSVNGDK